MPEGNNRKKKKRGDDEQPHYAFKLILGSLTLCLSYPAYKWTIVVAGSLISFGYLVWMAFAK